MNEPLFEIVPNISEGRDAAIVARAVAAVDDAGARVLHVTSDPVHHRSVITAAGAGSRVLDAAVALAGVAAESIDIREHAGVHPRMGALDVLPFVPLAGATMEAATALAHEAGRRIWAEHHIPSYYYGEAALVPERRPLPAVRPQPQGAPDAGDVPTHHSAGAVAIGARGVLVAFNVELGTRDIAVARRIARLLRERDGGLRTLRALAFAVHPDTVQLSFNVTDERATPLYRIVQVVRALAVQYGTSVVRSELIGCIPRSAVVSAALYALGVEDPSV